MAGSVDEVTTERLRNLAALRAPEGARMLSVYFDLSPNQFATGEARATEIESVLDEADRRGREAHGPLSPEGRTAPRRGVGRTRGGFDRAFSAKGLHGLALFAGSPPDVVETLRLPGPG